MSHDCAFGNKGGHPQPWLLAPFALWLAHAPTMHHLFSRQRQCSQGRLQDVQSAGNLLLNVCVCNRLSLTGGRAQIYSINGGINCRQFAPHCMGQQIDPTCNNSLKHCQSIESITQIIRQQNESTILVF